MDSQSARGEPSDAVEDGIGILGPDERFGSLVVNVDELRDRTFQLAHAVVRPSLDLALRQHGEPALHLIQPETVSGAEVQTIARVTQEPPPNFLSLVGGVVVQNQMNSKIGGNDTINLVQKLAELNGSMARPALADHRSCGDVQGSEETGCAMALVIVSAAFGLSGQHRKDRLTAAERLDLTLLIYTKHHRMMKRIHVQADNVSHLVDQQRIAG